MIENAYVPKVRHVHMYILFTGKKRYSQSTNSRTNIPTYSTMKKYTVQTTYVIETWKSPLDSKMNTWDLSTSLHIFPSMIGKENSTVFELGYSMLEKDKLYYFLLFLITFDHSFY